MKAALHLVPRDYWHNKIKSAWEHRSVVWLSGTRRAGKTVLCQSIENAEYFDCELPRTRALLEDPQAFWQTQKGRIVVLDEIHRLQAPSELLKIAADYFPDTKVIATGSSTLGASSKFRDTLTGRKSEVWLTPIIESELVPFGNNHLGHRFLHGGLPPFFLSKEQPERDYQEWIDAFWAKDIQELFRLERRFSFQKFFELLLSQSGGIFEATTFAKQCEVSRPTIANYLSVLESTFVVHVVRPFSRNPQAEIISAPKVYGFDTGFVCYYKGWYNLRRQDLGYLWEHFVLNEIHAHLQTRDILYWRDKRKHEIDFILNRRGKKRIALECKWSAKEFEAKNFLSFSKKYPDTEFIVVAPDIDRGYNKQFASLLIQFVNLQDFISFIIG